MRKRHQWQWDRGVIVDTALHTFVCVEMESLANFEESHGLYAIQLGAPL